MNYSYQTAPSATHPDSTGNEGIYPPESFSVSFNIDGTTFGPAQSFTTTATERDPSGVGAAGIGRVVRNLSGTGRYLKFEATHAQAPTIPLILIDELQFEGAVLLGIEKSGANLILKWASGTLEESADLISGFTAHRELRQGNIFTGFAISEPCFHRRGIGGCGLKSGKPATTVAGFPQCGAFANCRARLVRHGVVAHHGAVSA